MLIFYFYFNSFVLESRFRLLFCNSAFTVVGFISQNKFRIFILQHVHLLQ